MKRHLLSLLCFVSWVSCLQAQTVITHLKEKLGTVNRRFLKEDETHDYAKLDVNDTYTVEYRFWNTNIGKVVGKVSVAYTQPEWLNETTLLPDFQRLDGEDELKAMYEPSEVLALFHEKLKGIASPKGDEMIWVEMQAESPHIKLYIVRKSDIVKNKGIPKRKMPIGELEYDEATSYFNVVAI